MEMDGTFDLETADWRWHQCNPPIEAYDDSQKHWVWAQLGRVELLPTARYARRPKNLPFTLSAIARQTAYVTEMANSQNPVPFAHSADLRELVHEA